jgi:branched-chain amino acid transport system ATP-binding protein
MESTVNGASRAALVAKGVCVHYAGVRAVDGVDLELKQGEIVGLIGPNGAGKTTFLNAISAFVPLTAGQLSIGEVDVSGWAPQRLVRHGLARTFQEVATFPQLTVFENVEVGALGAGLKRREARARARELLDKMGLGHHADQLASALPHGDERRVGIARAVAVQPRFLLLDEPAAGLDDAESHDLIGTIGNLRDELGCGILLVEHDMRIIFGVCERIQVLDYGKTIATGTASEISVNERVVAAYLGAKGAELASGN